MQSIDAFMSGEGDLRVLTACPFCNTSYSIRAARVVAQKDDAHVVHIECRQCGGSIIALILPNGIGSQSVGVMTDLTHDEVAPFSQAPVVNVDDAIVFHAALEEGSLLQRLTSSQQH